MVAAAATAADADTLGMSPLPPPPLLLGSALVDLALADRSADAVPEPRSSALVELLDEMGAESAEMLELAFEPDAAASVVVVVVVTVVTVVVVVVGIEEPDP